MANENEKKYAGLETLVEFLAQIKNVFSDKSHGHDDSYDAKGAADTALSSAKNYTDSKVENLASTTVVDNKISTHNTATAAHNDIRDLIAELTERFEALANCDDTTLDQMAEVVEYIKSNRDLIEEITTNKVNVSDIINNLTTNVSTKPLSAAQGVALKALIDTLQAEVDKKALASDLTSHTSNTSNPHAVTKSQVGLGNVDNTADADKAVLSATKLATARTIALSGDVSGSGSFDGSDNLVITATVADDSHNHIIDNIDGLQTALDAKAETDDVITLIDDTITDYGLLTIDLEGSTDGTAATIDADTFAGYTIDKFVMYNVGSDDGEEVETTLDADTLGGVAAADYATIEWVKAYVSEVLGGVYS